MFFFNKSDVCACADKLALTRGTCFVAIKPPPVGRWLRSTVHFKFPCFVLRGLCFLPSMREFPVVLAFF